MLPSKNRLNLRGNAKIFKKKKVVSDEFEIIGEKKNGIFKAAIIVSKKVAPLAVDRNRIKRLISESIQSNLKDLKFKGELVFIVKKNIANLKRQEVEKKLLSLLKNYGYDI